MFIQKQAHGLAKLNTKPVAYTGVIIVAIGTFLPLAFIHSPTEVHNAVNTFGKFLIGIGTYGAYVGRPNVVKSDAPANVNVLNPTT